MKKIIALSLVVIMLAAIFASCADDKKTPSGGSTLNPTGTTATPVEGYTSVNETVYVTADGGLNVRSTPDAESDTNKLGTMSYGKAVTRTGVNEATGWSRIMYNNEVAYVKSEFLSATAPSTNTTSASTETDVPNDKFVACNDETTIYTTVYEGGKDVHKVGDVSNVYTAPNKSKGAGTLKDGTAVKRVAVYNEKADDPTYGWSKIECEGKTYYIRNSQLKISFDAPATTTTAATSVTAAP